MAEAKAKAKNQHTLALAILIGGKLVGIGGLVIGGSNRVAGGIMLLIDGICIAVAITLALRANRQVAVQEEDDKAVLARMVREGTLKQYLRDIEDEKAAE